MKEGWKTTTIENACNINYGTRVVQKKDGGTIYPVYGGGGATFRMDRFNREDSLVISRFAMSKQCTRFVSGKFFLNDSGLTLSSKIESLQQDFLDWHILALNDEIYYLGKGIAQKNLDMRSFKQINLKIPSVDEQQHIVEELKLLSSIIEKKRIQLNELDNLAQSLFYEMFGNPIENEKGWEEKRLEEVCDVRDGTHDSPKYVIESDYVLITSKNIQDGEISFDNVNYITKEDYDKINVRSYVDDGDIIMAMIGTIGKPIIVKKGGRKFGIKNVALLKFRESHNITNVYVKSMLDNPTYMKYLHSLNRGGTQKFVSLKTIRNLPILLPPLDLQNQFASMVETIEYQKELIKKSIKEIEVLYNSRMDFWFNQ